MDSAGEDPVWKRLHAEFELLKRSRSLRSQLQKKTHNGSFLRSPSFSEPSKCFTDRAEISTNEAEIHANETKILTNEAQIDAHQLKIEWRGSEMLVTKPKRQEAEIAEENRPQDNALEEDIEGSPAKETVAHDEAEIHEEHIRKLVVALEHKKESNNCGELPSWITDIDGHDTKRKRQRIQIEEGNQLQSDKLEDVLNDVVSVRHKTQAAKFIRTDIKENKDAELTSKYEGRLAKLQTCYTSSKGDMISQRDFSESEDHIKLHDENPSGRLQSDKQVSGGLFTGIMAHFVEGGVNPKQLQVWRLQMKRFGGSVVELIHKGEKSLTHVFAADQVFLSNEANLRFLKHLRYLSFLRYAWIEDCLKQRKVVSTELYRLQSPFKSASISSCVKVNGESTTFSGSSAAGFVSPQLTCDIEEIDGNKSLKKNEVNPSRHWSNGLEIDFSKPQKQFPLNESLMNQFQPTSSEHGLTTYELPDLNKHITDIFVEMWHIYEDVLGDEWRSVTYKKVANKLQKLPYRISHIKDVIKIYGIGSSMIEKIKEIINTGTLQKLDNMKADPQVQIIKQFASVWGIGPKLARKLYQAGYRDVRDLLKEFSLSHMARVGVSYHDDLLLRIPRQEVEEAEGYVIKLAVTICPGVFVRVTGSFRRGLPTCGDIDILVTHPDGCSHKGFLSKLVQELQRVGFITENVQCSTQSLEGTKHKVDTFMGLCRLPNYQHHRRLDIKVYPKEAYAFALVYFTGNDVLNRRLRYAAQLKGFKLNDQGLFLRMGGKKGISSEISIPCETEEQVFSMLGFPYYAPTERNW